MERFLVWFGLVQFRLFAKEKYFVRTSIIYQSIYPYIQFVRARVLTQVGEVVSAVLLAARTGFFPYLRSCNRMRSHVVTKKTWTFDFEYSSWIDKLEGWIFKKKSLIGSELAPTWSYGTWTPQRRLCFLGFDFIILSRAPLHALQNFHIVPSTLLEVLPVFFLFFAHRLGSEYQYF